VDDRGRIALSIGLGALIGGVAGFFVFTQRGRELREDLAPRLDELLDEVDNLRTTFDRARVAVGDGLRTFNQLVSDEKASGPRRHVG
jgi:gas vesicle protein